MGLTLLDVMVIYSLTEWIEGRDERLERSRPRQGKNNDETGIFDMRIRRRSLTVLSQRMVKSIQEWRWIEDLKIDGYLRLDERGGGLSDPSVPAPFSFWSENVNSEP